MNAIETTDLIRQRLLEQREQILAQWRAHRGDAAGDEWDLKDPEEQAVLLTQEDVEQQIINDDLNLIRKIDFALQRLDSGNYFECANCGRPIPKQRLLAKPSASLCLSCQELKAVEDAEHAVPRGRE
jgi:DnaK suppressor protein